MTQQPGGPVIAFSYGFRGSAGQWWHDVVTAGITAAQGGAAADFVFSDIMMPGGMSGIDLARAIAARPRPLPVLLTSGYADPATHRAAPEGTQILKKPYTLAELAAALRR